jgi:hypothetical protein
MPSIAEVAQRKLEVAKYIARREYYSLCRKTDFTWRYLGNFGPWLEYRKGANPLTAVQKRVLNDLRRNGFAITHVDEFLPNPALYDELAQAVARREEAMADVIAKTRAQTEQSGEIKSYLVNLFERGHVFQPDDIFIRFAVLPEITNLVNCYFGMLTKLCFLNVWHNLPMKGEARESQLWHRDPEDRYILKLFVYMTDVGEGSGPTHYAPGTHMAGAIKQEPESLLCQEGLAINPRTTDEQMAKVVSPDKWVKATGPKKTILFGDMRGFHKGGLVRESDRVLYHCMYNSQATSYPKSARPRLSSMPRRLNRAESYMLLN